MIRWFLMHIFWLLAVSGFAQQGNIRLQVLPVDSVAGSFKVRSNFASRLQLEKYLRGLPDELIGKGYLAASVDSFRLDSPKAVIHLYLGPRYQWGNLQVDPAYQSIVQALGATPNGRRGKNKIPWAPATDYRQMLLDYFEENGHPFATVSYDSIKIIGQTLDGRLVIDKGLPYKIDSIAQGGTLRQNPAFIHRYLGIAPGSLYQKSKLEKIDQRLDELPFAQQMQPWELSLLGTGGVVNVFLENKRSNVLNILLGVMPASTQTPENKLQITGDANIMLRNSFRVGETIGINWQQIQYKSPRLNLLYMQPYLFGSRAGIDFYFDLLKKDTQFVNLQFRLGMPYEFSVNKAGKLLFLYQQTNVTTVDTNYVKQTGRLPDLAATDATSLGLDYNLNATNYRLNPRTGHEINLSVLGGLKRITPSGLIQNLNNPAEPGKTFSELYDSLALKTHQVRIRLSGAKYYPLGAQTVLKLAANLGWYESGNFFRNELFQLGGFRLLRGFDEESIYAQKYGVLTSEFRFLSGRNSYFFGFADGGFATYRDENQQFSNSYIGTGLGMVLETKNSLINISWAIGKRNDLPLDLRQSKIHLGLINFF